MFYLILWIRVRKFLVHVVLNVVGVYTFLEDPKGKIAEHGASFCTKILLYGLIVDLEHKKQQGHYGEKNQHDLAALGFFHRLKIIGHKNGCGEKGDQNG